MKDGKWYTVIGTCSNCGFETAMDLEYGKVVPAQSDCSYCGCRCEFSFGQPNVVRYDIGDHTDSTHIGSASTE